MLLRKVDRCPAKLDPGEYKRSPTTGPLIGIFLACPACGYRCITVLGAVCATGPGEAVADDSGGTLTVRGTVKCLLCPRPAQIANGEYRFVDA